MHHNNSPFKFASSNGGDKKVYFPLPLNKEESKNSIFIPPQHCEVMKQAAMPPCLGGGESGTNVAYRVDHNLTICVMANRPVEVRILPSQLKESFVILYQV